KRKITVWTLSLFKVFIFVEAFVCTQAAVAQSHKGISFQGVIKLPTGEYPNRPGMTVNARILSPNGCILREEEFSGVNITNGYLNLAIGTGLVGGYDPSLTLAKVMDNSSMVSSLTCLNSDGSVNGAVTSFNPAVTSGIRKLRVSLTIDSYPIVADFNMRAVAYAINAETLNGKTSANFININDSKSLNQANMESIFERFTKLDALLNNTDTSGNHLGLNISANGNVGIGSSTPEASFVVSKTAPAGTISSAGTAVTGVGTNFTSAFSVGDQIVVAGQTKTITAITDPNNLTVDTAFSADLAASTPYTRVGAIFNSGNVGIGTSTPTYALDVVGGLRATGASDIGNGAIQYSPTGYAGTSPLVSLGKNTPTSFYMNAIDTGSFQIRRAGSAFGTVIRLGSAWGTPAAPQTSTTNQSLGGIQFEAYTGVSGASNGYSSGASIGASASANASLTNSSAYLTFATTPKNSITQQERMRITDAGNIGMGTNAPTASLVVNKTAPAGTIASTGTDVTGVGTNFTTAFSVGDQIVANGQVKTITGITDATNLIVNSAFSSDLAASTAYARVGTIFSAGNVGIGTTAPRSPLHVNVTSSIPAGRFSQVNGTSVPDLLTLELNSNAGLDRGVGITFNTPTAAQSSATGGRLYVAGEVAGTNTYMAMSTATGNVLSEKVRITSTGNVGIGATAPTAKLEVNGHIAASGSAATLGACGTSPAITGNDTKGYVTVGSGATTSCVITFNSAFASAPVCTVTWRGSASTIGVGVTASVTALTVNFSADSQGLSFNYHCLQ
ncbi:MAG: beta strand repeat-containing protein, partial [Bdellovibrio sp.]